MNENASEKMKSLLIALSCALAAFSRAEIAFSTAEEDLAPLHMAQSDAFSSPVDNHYVVVLKSDVMAAEAGTGSPALASHIAWLNEIMGQSNVAGESQDVQSVVQNQFDFPKFQGYAGRFSELIVREIRTRPEVAFIEQDRMVFLREADHKQWVEKNATWGLQRLSQQHPLPKNKNAEDRDFEYRFDESEQGEGVDVYVVDTGINTDHFEFEGRARWGTTTAWFGLGRARRDGNGHGTHCAGIIAGRFTGVAKEAKLIAVKVLLDNGGGMMSWIMAGVEWVVKQHNRRTIPVIGDRPKRRSVVNMSLGGGRMKSLDLAVDKGTENGVLFVVAAGNEDSDACYSSPAASQMALTVGASNIRDERAYFSNYGRCVDIFAPGVDILSSWNAGENSYRYLSGTSMAAPHVAGVAAAMYSSMPAGTDPLLIKAKIIDAGLKNKLSKLDDESPNLLLFKAPPAA